MAKIIVNANPFATRIAVVENGELIRYKVHSFENMEGNIYKGIVTNIVSSMEAAFVDIGIGRDAFLCTSDLYITADDFYLFPLSHYDEKRFLTFKKDSFGRPLHIKDVVNVGQSVIVQVVKAKSLHKGPRVSTYLTIPGRYVALLPKTSKIGVSKRIKDQERRKELHNLLFKYQKNGLGIIARTASSAAANDMIIADIQNCIKIYNAVKINSLDSSAPALLYREDSFVVKSLRDSGEHISEILVDNKAVYDQLMRLNWLDVDVKLLNEPTPIFDAYDVSKHIPDLYNKRLSLKSGGSIVIEETEALVAIDVNSGKTTGKSLEDTIFKTNMEACDLIAKQVKLRNLGGIIVIDFIDMVDELHKEIVVNNLIELMSDDRLKCHVNAISSIGLVEMTRKSATGSLSMTTTTECPICKGSGRLKSPDITAMDIYEKIMEVRLRYPNKEIIVEAPKASAKLISDQNIRNVTTKVNDRLKEKFYMEI